MWTQFRYPLCLLSLIPSVVLGAMTGLDHGSGQRAQWFGAGRVGRSPGSTGGGISMTRSQNSGVYLVLGRCKGGPRSRSSGCLHKQCLWEEG